MTEVLPYRLSIAPALEAFRPELEYACDFLDRCHFLRRDTQAEAVLHYGPDAPPNAVRVPAALFPGGVRITGDGIHPDHAAIAGLTDGRGPVPFLPPVKEEPTDGPMLRYDALGLIFFMLSRIEERDHPQRDPYGRFPYVAALAMKTGRYAEALADRAAQDLAAALLGPRMPKSRTSYRVIPTHDVDRLRGYHRLHAPLWEAAGDTLKRLQPGRAWTRLRDAYLSGEPWRSVRVLMDLSERHGLTSRFFFMGPSRLAMDSPYVETMPVLLRRVADEIGGRGHALGFHPGFATAEDEAEWRRQRDGLESVLDRPVRDGRQHVLRYRAEITPDIWDAAGMEADYTLGFPEATGFRSGTCRPYAAYSLRRRRPLTLLQTATAVMDFGLFGGKYRALTVAAALAEAEQAAKTCRHYGGDLVILFHTGQIRPPQSTFYEALLERVH